MIEKKFPDWNFISCPYKCESIRSNDNECKLRVQREKQETRENCCQCES